MPIGLDVHRHIVTDEMDSSQIHFQAVEILPLKWNIENIYELDLFESART
jgi:hypothetical protein